jgi:autotransporter-associated beta strand protein
LANSAPMSLTLRLLSRFKSLPAVESVSKLIHHSFRFLFVLLILTVGPNAFAQKTWQPTTGGDWQVGANWSGGIAPVAGDVVIINTDQSGNIFNIPDISLSSFILNGTCLLESTAAATPSLITVTGTFSIGVGEIVTLGLDGSGFRVNILLSSTCVGSIAGTLNVTSGTVNRFLQNDGDLTITQTGLVRDNFSTTGFDSDFILGATATLRVGSINGITTSPTTSGNVQVTGVRTFPTTSNYAYVGSANQITGNGLPATVNDLTIANTGGGGNNTVTLTSPVGVSNTLFVNSGVFALAANNVTTVSAINMTGTSITGTGTITLAGNITTNASGITSAIGAPIALSGGDRTLIIADGGASPDLQISSSINGTFGLQKNGAGLLHFFGANTYTGLTTVAAGILRVGSPSGLGSTAGGTIVNAGAAIDIIGINYPANESLTLNGTGISGGGALFNSSVTGATFGGLVTLGSSASISGSNGTINISNGGTIAGAGFDLTLDGAAGGTLASALGTGTGGIIKNGAGTWILSGANTFTGSVLINTGTVRLSSVGALNGSNTVVFGAGSTGVLQLNGNTYTIAGLNTNVTVGTPIVENSAAGVAQLTVLTAGASTYAGVIRNGGAGTLSIGKAGVGSLTLSGNNTHTGGTTLLAGTLNINSSTAVGSGTFNINGGTIDNTSAGAITLSTNNPQNWSGDFSFTGTQNLNLGTGSVTPNASRQVTVNGGELTVGGIIGGGAIGITKLGTGTLTLTAANTFSSGFTLGTGQININNANALGNVAGTFTINGGSIGNTTGGAITTANYPMSWGGDFTFNGTQNLNLGTGAIALTANRQVTVNSNTLTVGGLINAATFSLTKSGTGTLALGSNNVTLNGLTVNAGGFTSTSSTLFLAGNFSNAGTFNNNSGTVHFNGAAAQAVAGVTYHNLITSAAGQKNATGAITVNNNLTNSTIFDLGSNTLLVSGVLDNTGGDLRFSGATNGLAVSTGTVTYYGSSQTITTGTYNNLVINQASGQASLGGNVTVNGTLTLTNGILNLSGFNLTLGPTATISVASPSATRMIIANGSQVVKTFSGVGSFLFPIGDNVGTLEYSPITVNVTAGTGFPANVGVTIVDSKHPNNSSTANFLTRYWEIDQSGIAGCVATITATYPGSDISGTEANIHTAQLPGTFNQATNPWIKYSALTANTLTATGATLISGTNAFTGIRGADPLASITGGGVTICVGSSASLNTTTTGDGPFTFSWSPATGLSATNIANPVASPITTETYTVTITDANGIVDTDVTTITVNAVPVTPVVTPAGPVVACEGSASIVLTSDAASGNQWYKDGVLIGGATATTYNITTTPGNSGSYTVISTITGCASAVSNAVAVTINALPLTTPVVAPATTTICSGNTVTVNIAGSQAGINYELFDGVTSLSSPVAGTGGAINLITSALTANTTITVRATNPTTTCTTLLSGTSVVTVTPIPSTPVVTPAGPVVACEGSASIVLTSDAASGNQWYKDGVLIGGATATTYNITTTPGNSGSYTVISTITGCYSAVSNAVAVTINALPLTTPVVAPATTTICSGNTVTVNIAGSQAGINYELFDGVTSLSSAVAGTGGAINIVTSPLTANTTITVRATNPTTTCTTLLSGTSVVTVTPIPSTPVVTPAGPVTVCEGSASIVLTSDAASGNQWYKDGVLIGGATATTYNITTTPGNSGSYTVISTITGCASAVSNAVAVTINALPLTTPVVAPATTTICSGNTVTVNIAGSQAGINYELFDGVTSLSSAVAGTGGAINLVTSPLTANTTITVRATNPTTTCTTLLSGTSIVTVTPIPSTPVVTPAGPVTVCEGSATIVLTSDAASGNQWYKDGVLIGGATATTYNITTTPGNSGSYTVISTITGCYSAVSNAVAVTINALPLTTPVVAPATTTICSGNTVTVNIAGSQAGINYELFDGVTSLSSAVAGTGGAINLITSALTANTTITVRATNPTTTCTTLLSGTSVVTVTPIPATPVVTPAGPVVACEGSASIVLTSDAASGNQWYKDGVLIGGATATTYNITTTPGNSGSYTVISTITGCYSAVSNAVAVTINALPLTTPVVAPATTTICSGNTVTVNIAGSQAGINYELFDGVTSLSSPVAGTGGALNLVTSPLTANTTITVRATNPTTTCTTLLSGTSVVTVTPIPATPVVTPAGPVVACEGSANIVLTSDAASGNQWYKDGVLIGGATATTYNITTTPGNSGSYTVISTITGCASAVSNAVAVTINALPLTTPVVAPATTTICSGNTVTVNIAGSQAGINYELFDGVTSLSSPVAGTGGAINLITSALTANTTITVRATNPTTTCTTLLSGTSVVTVTPIPSTPVVTPAGPVVACEGSASIVLTSDAASGNQWYKDGVLIGGATATTYNITTTPGNSGSYTVISTVTGCASAVSNAVAVTINALPLTTPVVAPATTTICSGNTVTVNIAGSQAGINYELFDGVTSLSSPVAGTGGAINLITSALTANTTITVRATNPTTTCTTLLSGTSVVTVTPIPATPVVTPAGPVVACEGSASIVLTSDAASGNQWYKDGVLIGGATATTYNITTTPGNSGSYTVISTVTGCSSAVSNAVAVTINALPLTTPVVAPATTTICSGNTVTVNIAGSQAGINYELFDGVTSLSSPVAGTGGALNLVTSPLTANTTITVRATNPTTTCTTLLSGTSVVTVTPIPATPVVTPAGPVVACEGSANIVLTSDAASGNQWYKDGVLIGGATATTYNITTTPGNSGSYTVISTITGCASAVSNAVAVTINALPLTTPVVAPATTTICSGNTVTVNIAGSQAGINYELFDGVTSLSSPVAGTGGAINIVTSPLTANTTITVRATNPTTTCTTLLSGTSVVTVTPIPSTPVVTPAGPVVACEGSASIVLTSDAASGNQWYKDGVLIGGATATTYNITTTPGNSGSYTVVSTVTGCASAVSNAVAVTINALPFNTPGVSPLNATICSGSNVTVTITGTEPGINYRLLDGVTPVSTYVAGTGAAINLVSSALTSNTTLTVEAQNPVTGCSIILPGTTTITVGATIPTPVISPVSPVIACVGDPSVVLTSSAVSGNQWYKDGIPIPGEVNQTLSISTAVINSGSYTVYEIQAGCTSAASVSVNVTINSIASPPVASNPNPICVGQAIPTLTAAGSNLNWYSDAALTTLVGTGSPFTPSATEVDNLTAGSYLLYVTQTIGCESPATTVTVVVNPAVVANAGVDTSLCDGQNVTLGGSPSATGGNGTYTYSWTSVPPGFTSTQSNPVVTPTLGVTTYELQVTDAFGCTDSDQIDVTVNEVPVFTVTNNTSGGTGQICSGSTININLASPTVGATITLQPVAYGAFITGGLYAAGGTFVNGNTVTEGGGLTNTSNSPVSIIYTFSVATPDCTNPVTQQATIVINPSPVLSITNSSASICSGSAVNVLLNSATSGAVIQITSVNYGSVTGGTLSAGSTFTPGSSITESLTNTGNNPVTVRYNLEVVANGCTTSGFFADVVVNPNPTFVATNFVPEICHGDQTSIFFGSVTAGHQINVVNVFYGAVTGGTVNPGVTTFTSATPLQEALFNNTNAPIDVEYTFNVTTPATTPVCPIAPVNQVVTVRVYPNPTFTVTNNSGGGTGTICSGQQSSILLNTPISGGQVRLASVTYGAVIGSYTTGALFANGQTLSETLTNNTGAPITVDYEFEAIVSSCAASASQVVSVTVKPTPNVVALPASQTICSGANTSIALSTTNGVAGATYSWTVVQSGVSGATADTGASINQTLTATGSTAGTATYTITPTAAGCNGTPITVIVTVNPLPDVVAAPNAETICSGATTNINLSTTNGVAGATYSWTVVQSNVSGATAGFGASINQTLTATTSSSGTATYTITPTSNGCAGTPIVVVVTVSPTPNVVALPASQTICSGANTSIALSTTNGVAGATYSWTVVQSGVSGATADTGATINQTLTATGSTAGTATYTIAPTAAGCNGTPITVIVTVNPLPDVVAAPNAETICSGATTNINLSTTNGVAGATYSWTVVQSNVSGATAGFGASINQTLTATTSSSGTATYTITPTSNGCAGTPIVVVVTVSPTPNVVALPASQTICSGSNTSIALSTTNGVAGATYSWTVVQSGVSGATADTGASINQTLTATGSTAGTATYTITPTASGCNGTPITVIVTVNPLPDVVAAPNAETICSGATTNINLSTTNGVAGATYSWTVVQSNVSGATAGFGASINQTLTATTSSSGTATYTITPTSNGCAGTPIVVVVTVNPSPNVVALPASQTICSGANTSIALSTTNGVAGATYSWTVVQSNVSGATADTGATINQTLTATGSTAGTATYTITPTASGCNGTPITVIVTVNPLPDVVAAPNAETICSGATTNINLSTTNGVAGATYSWTVVQSNVSGATAGFGTTINQTLTATTSSSGTATYTITPTSNGCAGTPIVVVVTVNPSPNVVALPASQTICSGANTNIALSTTNGVAGATYSWTVVQSNVSGATADTGATINQTLTATGSTAGTATYTITPTASGCNGTPITVIVTVNPLPDVVAAPNAETICSGATTNINLSTTNGVAGATYSWTVVQSNVSGATAGFGTTINQTLTATTSSSGTATYTITPTSNGCAGTPIVVVVTVNPSPNVVALPASQTICSGANTSIALSTTNGVAGATYSWTVVQSGVSGATADTGATINQTLTATGSTAGTATYTITPTAAGCNGTPITVIVTVNPLPDVVAAPNAETICSGATTNINLSTTNGVAGATYSWTVVQSNVSGATAGFGTTINQTLTATTSSSGTATYTITPTSNGCAGTPIVVVVTVNPASITTSSPLTITRCSGEGVLNFTPAFNVAGTTYTWTSSISGPITPASVTSSGSSMIVDNPINVGSFSGTVTYAFIPTAPGGCIGAAFNYVVTVNPEPVGANDSKTICSDESVGYNLLLNVATLGNNVGSSFSWLAADNVNPLVTGESTAPVTGPTITDILVNQTNIDQSVVYTVTPTSTNGCVGASFQITVTVKPEPVGVSATAADICSGSSVGYNLQNNVNTLGNSLATYFTWTATAQPDVAGETTSLKSGSIIDDVLINNSGVNQVVTYTVTPTSQTGNCLGNSFTIMVNVNPKAIFTAGPDLAVCVDQNDIEIQGSVTFAPSTYSWSGGTGTFDNNTLEKPRYILSAADKAIVVPTVRVLTLTTAASGVCPAEVETMNLTLNPLPNASFIGLPASTPENGPDLKLNAFQAGGLFTIVPGSGLTATTIDGGTGFDQTFLTPANATLYDGTPASVNVITYSYTDVNGCMNSTSQNLRVNPLTDVDFTIIEKASLDGEGDLRVCADTGDLLLTPIIPGIPPDPGLSRNFISSDPILLPIIFDGTNYFIRTTNTPSDIYTVDFYFENSSGVQTIKSRTIKVQASPVVSFISSGSCIDSPTTFTNTSILNPTPAGPIGTPTIALVEWNFGDFSGVTGAPAGTIPLGTNAGRTTGTYDMPSHTYGSAASYTVSLKVTTTQGCASTFTNTTPVIVGTIPVVNFDFFAICNNDSTKFKALITNLGSSTIAQYNWNFDDGDVLNGLGAVPPNTHGDRTTGTYEEPTHKYVSTGGYDPTLSVTTNLGCTSLTRTRPVTIVPYVTVVVNSSNPPENFDTPAGWFIENLIDPDDNTFVSWKHGIPTGDEITAANSAGSVWWSGNNANTYFANEKSVVNSPCFDLNSLERPMIALDYYADLETSLDGVVLQYSIDGGATWELVGPAITETRDQGINWFNGAAIPSNPGNQILGQYGWTGIQNGWKNARFNLDMIPKAGNERQQVRLRLALASNGTNAPGVTYDGFAFDNVYVGEKQRNVLVEHFTTSQLGISVTAGNYLNGLYNSQLLDRGFSDFDQIQYHVNFNGVDPLNRDNPEDPAARALRYRVSQPPYTIMDGKLEPGKFTGIYNEINKIELDRRALVDPIFDLELEDLPTAENTKMSVRLTLTARRAYTRPILVNVALLEKDVNGNKNVLRKNLFTPAGRVIELPFGSGDQRFPESGEVVLDVPIVNPNGLMLVGYVQDLQTNEILQSVVMRNGVAPKQTDPITAVDDIPAKAALNAIQIFPNPASLEFKFGLPADVAPGTSWKILDQRGIAVLSGDFEGAVNGIKLIDISELANAVYYVVMTSPQGATVHRKLVVVNRN